MCQFRMEATMSQLSTLDRRSFFRRTLAGGAAMGLVSEPWWEAAAQLVEGTPIRDVRGVGLDDPQDRGPGDGLSLLVGEVLA